MYNRRNFLLKVKKVCELYQKVRIEGVPIARTFRDHIEPVFPMHLETFYHYLGINYERELRELDADGAYGKKENKNQIKLF
jgi:hypothetical protein